jgi:hypothetical protein
MDRGDTSSGDIWASGTLRRAQIEPVWKPWVDEVGWGCECLTTVGGVSMDAMLDAVEWDQRFRLARPWAFLSVCDQFEASLWPRSWTRLWR